MKTQKELRKEIMSSERTYLTTGAAIRGEWDRLTGDGFIFFIFYVIRYIFKGVWFLVKHSLLGVVDVLKYILYGIPKKLYWGVRDMQERKNEKAKQIEIQKAKTREEIYQKMQEMNDRHQSMMNMTLNKGKVSAVNEETIKEMKEMLNKYDVSESTIKKADVRRLISKAILNPEPKPFKNFEIGDTLIVADEMGVVKKDDKFYRLRDFMEHSFIVIGYSDKEVWNSPETGQDTFLTLELWCKEYKDSRFYTDVNSVKLKH